MNDRVVNMSSGRICRVIYYKREPAAIVTLIYTENERCINILTIDYTGNNTLYRKDVWMNDGWPISHRLIPLGITRSSEPTRTNLFSSHLYYFSRTNSFNPTLNNFLAETLVPLRWFNSPKCTRVVKKVSCSKFPSFFAHEKKSHKNCLPQRATQVLLYFSGFFCTFFANSNFFCESDFCKRTQTKFIVVLFRFTRTICRCSSWPLLWREIKLLWEKEFQVSG